MSIFFFLTLLLLIWWFNWYCTHFLKIGFVVARGGFYSFYIQQGNKLYKERQIVRKKLSFMNTKRLNTFFKKGCNSMWVQFHVYLIWVQLVLHPHGIASTFYMLNIKIIILIVQNKNMLNFKTMNFQIFRYFEKI